MNTPEEAANYLVAIADEYLTLSESAIEEDRLKVQEAAKLVMEKINEPSPDQLAETIKQLMKLIEDGAKHYNGLYDQISVALQLSTDDAERSRLAIALSECAGAISALGAVVGHVLSDEASSPTRLEDIFTGAGLSYPKALAATKPKLYIPK